MKFKAVVITTTLLAALFVFQANVHSQDPKPSPSPDTPESTAINKKDNQEKPSATAVSAPARSPEPDVWHQDEMTGDWGGTRSRWKEKGVELEFRYIGIFQSLASGGTRSFRKSE